MLKTARLTLALVAVSLLSIVTLAQTDPGVQSGAAARGRHSHPY